ncbi:dihydroxyacetone kinase [Ameyamaea chiangmaiensis NBRC 103196]|uniref:Dihydroxyacetone kinase family protein n=1 Tax=Ameyamaea chiangmaiensis TaxID=442969 RepID=A0A850P4T2_9PROT|nr:dihydroxyacetone kinase family protein [Ameyamaea chiangmaiensis]MBS4075500.1 dihydroxyacetone kinase family protein [Ameyamaea chiangmaiensis]NVN38968.1 dihydroxyacetone kinase family protein [Ameyamaea chiangmaiensis]GBQ69517.1 dihydroxyacetone kinase [Ameyamaea chiangmaiensis NBRC 103196]
MTRICGNADDFAASALRGFCLAYHDVVRPVRGGVLRAKPGASGKVALVVGGGSGHYPAFVGYVGEGFADASVAGDIFASPSTQAIINVAREADRGGGVILGYGNYAGDVLNFGIAAQRLQAEGIETRVLATTDDVASADDAHRAARRGIAGDLTVFKITGAAAEAGLSIDDVARVGHHANDWTRTFGVAFGGCTIPGEKEKLFEVPAGRMALGLGLHGEPGIDEQAIPSAPDLATLLFERVLAEAPSGVPRTAAVLLNGLGSTKQEELFVLWDHLSALFADAGYSLVAPLVGEYATSLEMAGCSLTVTWLDDELEPFWRAAVETPALRHGVIEGDAMLALPRLPEPDVVAFEADSRDGRAGGICVAAALSKLSQALGKAEAELGRIDAQAGDGDHGQGMARGSSAADRAAQRALAKGAGARTVLGVAADAWADRAGGTSGALWGEGLRAFSTALDDTSRPTLEQLADGSDRALKRIVELGKAKPGDKTLVDALWPFVETLKTTLGGGERGAEAWRAASEAAQAAAEGTRDLVPRLGRAKTHKERSKGYPDAGALSLALATCVIADFFVETTG